MFWRLIETAPKDGSYFLGYSPDSTDQIMIVHWSGAVEKTEVIEDDWYERDTGFRLDVELTHWMPLPFLPGSGKTWTEEVRELVPPPVGHVSTFTKSR